MSGQYILGPDHVPTPEPDLDAWGRWMGTANLVVGRTLLADGLVGVVTTFLGLDHNDGDGPRQLFETRVIFARPGMAWQNPTGELGRYPTWATAEAGHADAVAAARARLLALGLTS